MQKDYGGWREASECVSEWCSARERESRLPESGWLL
jgi:hypothetical protein